MPVVELVDRSIDIFAKVEPLLGRYVVSRFCSRRDAHGDGRRTVLEYRLNDVTEFTKEHK